MERIEGGCIKIVGVMPQTSTESRRRDPKEQAEETCKLSKYFTNVVYQDSSVTATKTFANNSIFIGCLGIDSAPKARIVQTVNLNGIFFNDAWMRRRGRSSNAFAFTEPTAMQTTRRVGSPVIIFKFDEKPYKRAMFYKAQKTLVIGTLFQSSHGIQYLELVMNWLKEAGLIEYNETADQGAVETPTIQYKKSIEFHGGQRVYVNLPIPRRTCKVGCDPEFEVTEEYNGAIRVIQPPYNRYQGTGVNQEIGLDGAGMQVEIRPKAFENPADTVSYMIGIMKRIHGDRFSVVGDRHPLGGHIHIGCVPHYDPPQDLKWLLDYFLGTPTINLSGTARSCYRAMAFTNSRAVETKPWGFEYRTPPAAIFRSPEFARLAMKICKNVVEAFVNCQTIIVNETPTFEDYWNYAGFTPREYERWVSFLQDYRSFMADPLKYHENAIENWTSEDALNMFPSQINREAIERWERDNAENLRMEREAQAENERRMAEARAIARERLARERAEASDPRRIQFSDDWGTEQRQLFGEIIRTELPEAEFPILNINLFGLGAQRGMVTWGYTVDGLERLLQAGNDTWNERYGVPYEVRVSGDRQVIQTFALAIAREYRNHVISLFRETNPATAGMSTPAESISDAIDAIDLNEL